MANPNVPPSETQEITSSPPNNRGGKNGNDIDFIDLIPRSDISEVVIIFVFTIGLFLWRAIKKRLSDWEENLLLSQKQDQTLQIEAVKIMTISRADRVVIGELSSGNKGLSGTSFVKIIFRKEVKIPALRPLSKITGSDSIDLANIQDEVRQLFREGEIVIYDKDKDDINKMCSYHLYKVNAQAFFEEILYFEDQPIGVIAYYFSEPLSEQCYQMIKTSPTIYYSKEEVVNILTPELNWFKKILSFVF